jgi:hypothetical protein
MWQDFKSDGLMSGLGLAGGTFINTGVLGLAGMSAEAALDLLEALWLSLGLAWLELITARIMPCKSKLKSIYRPRAY